MESLISLALNALKIGVTACIPNEVVKEIAGVTADGGIKKIEKLCLKYQNQVEYILSDDEMRKNDIPQKKMRDIRENIKEFIRNIDVEKIVSMHVYDETEFSNALAEQYKKMYEQEFEDDFKYIQVMLHSLAKKTIENIKKSEDFEKDRIIDCYRILIELKNHNVKDEMWKNRVIKIFDELMKKFETIQTVQANIPHLITNPPSEINKKTLVCRDKEVAELYEKIESSKCILLVNGFGGVGKTTIAKVLYHKIKEEYDYIGWIEYNDSLKQSILNSCILFLEEEDQERRFEKILHFFRSDAKKILFIDNVTKGTSEDKWLRNITGMPMKTIVTSRLSEMMYYEKYAIDFLSEDECVDLFYGYCTELGKGEDEEIVRDLVRMVQCHTLSVELLAKGYDSQDDLKEYYEQLKKRGFEYPNLEVEIAHTESAYTIAEHLRILFNIKVRTAEEIRILRNFTLMPVKDIPAKVCKWINCSSNDIKKLVNTGWLSQDKKTYYMHPVIRETILLDKKDYPVDIGHEFLESIENEKFFVEGESYIDALNKLEIAEKVLDNISQNKKGEHPNVYNILGWISNEHGRYDKALEFHIESLKAAEKIYGEGHPDVATSYNNIGAVYCEQGNYGKALEYYEKSLEIFKKMCGENHLGVATVNNNIGSVHRELGDYENALKYHKKSLEIKKIICGEEHPDVAAIYNNIGLVYDAQGEYKKALEYYENSLETSKKTCGEEHPDIAKSYNNIGSVYRKLGDYEKALEYCEKSLKMRRKLYGGKHPDVASSCNFIGLVYDELKEYEKALEYYEESLEIAKEIYAEEHPDMATSYNNIGAVFYAQREYKKALQYYENSLRMFRKIYGERHPDVAMSYNNIGNIYYKQGEYEKALEYHENSLEIKKVICGEEHPDVAMSYNNIGAVYEEQGEYEKALEYYGKDLKICKKTYGKQHPHTKSVHNNIVNVYILMGKWSTAIEYIKKNVEGCDDIRNI